jgi:hypothetical protein
LSASKPRKAGEPTFPQPKPGLRLIKPVDERPRPEPDPELKELLNDMNRRYRVQRERIERDPDGKDAA